jgi:hypothetical protein
MTGWRDAWREALRTGSTASLASTAALVARGQQERSDAAQPVNGPSQWVWGLHAPYERGFTVRHTVTGYLIHHAMSVFWAGLFEKARPRRPVATVAAASVTAAVAYVVDFHVVPRRLSPGFDVALSRRGLFATYAAFAIGLAAMALVRDSRRRSP